MLLEVQDEVKGYQGLGKVLSDNLSASVNSYLSSGLCEKVLRFYLGDFCSGSATLSKP
jgi:hypothetical protein